MTPDRLPGRVPGMLVKMAALLALSPAGCAEATSSPGGGENIGQADGGGGAAGADPGGADLGGSGDGEAGGGPGGGAGAGGADGGGQGGGDLGAGGQVGGDQGDVDPGDAPCQYREDGLFVCGPDWLILNIVDGGTVREAALPVGTLAVVQAAAGVDDRAHRFVRLGKPGGVDPALDEAAGLATLLWADAFPPALGEEGGAEVTEERSDDGTRLSWKATSRDVRYGVMYVIRGEEAATRTLIPPRTGGLRVDVVGLLQAGAVATDIRSQDGAVELPVSPLANSLLLQWAETKPLLCPALVSGGAGTLDTLLRDSRFSADHKLLAVLDMLDAVSAVLRAMAPADSWNCVRDHVAAAIVPTMGAILPQNLAADGILAATAGVLAGALAQPGAGACLGGSPTLLSDLAAEALEALGAVTELDAPEGGAGCDHAASAGFRVELEVPFERLGCAPQEVCDNRFDDDCTGAVDDDERCGCDAERYVPYCDGDELLERNGCGQSRAIRRCDHGCDRGECGGCEDPTYDPYCDDGDMWEANDCGSSRFVRACEFGCELGRCEGCEDPNFDPYCERDELWERNDCGEERRVRDCEFGCDDGRCEACEDPVYDRYCDGGDVFERNDCGDERGVVDCDCGCDRGACNALACDAGATRCGDDVQETCIDGCGWDGPANCACGCDGRVCAGIPASDGETQYDREGNDNASTRRQGNSWVISGAGRVGALWADGHDPVILVTGFAVEGDDDWYYLTIDDGAFGSLQPRVLLEPPAGTDLDLRVAYLNNVDRVFEPDCDVGDPCENIAGHVGCCSTNAGDNDDEVSFDAETGIGQENSGVLLIRVEAFRTPNVCDFYTLYIWI